MTSSKLDPLRVRIRRLQFTVGLGFLALILGSVLSVALAQRLAGRSEALPFEWMRFLLGLTVQKLWLIAVLPGLCYGAARIIELRPLSTALGAALSGQLFISALTFVQDGLDGWVERGWVALGLEVAVFAGGVWLSQYAVGQGRAAALRQQARVKQQVSVRQDEYAEFLREAERSGEKLARRDEAKAEAAPTPETPPAPAEASPPAEPTPAAPDTRGDTSKTPAA